MEDDEQRRLERFGRLRPPSFSGAESEDAQWWEAYERCRPVSAVPITWQEFSYEIRFSKLARHTVWLVPTDRERIRRFIDGLIYQLRLLMTREKVSGATFDEVVDIARQIEVVSSQERSDREAKRPRGSGGFGGIPSRGQSYHSKGRPYRPAQTTRPAHHGTSASHGSYSAHSGQSSFSALTTQSSHHASSAQASTGNSSGYQE
ncbi:uncharacterized protein [Nicotiana tomentosiformis]|uniref:uncharacterized protein n=1 Tax=Nicotiana tomentosiformis TaxID=4098 RepID=UPI00388C6597